MKLYITCSSCHKDIKLDKKANTKFEFERKFGKNIEIACPHCGASNTKHVNRTFAKPQWYWIGISLVGSLVLSLILVLYLGIFGFLFISLPGVMAIGQQKSINAYNRGMIPRS